MRIIIAGGGGVGFHLAKLLAGEELDITLIDNDRNVLEYTSSHLDVLTVQGDVSSPKVLKSAGVADADMFVAVTASQELNVMAAIMAKSLGCRKTIARESRGEYGKSDCEVKFDQLGVDVIISPKQLAAQEIVRLIQEASLTEVYEFDSGKLYSFSIFIDRNSPISGKTILEIAGGAQDVIFRPVIIKRSSDTYLPNAQFRIMSFDHVYFIAMKNHLDQILQICGKEKLKVSNVMILGGSIIGRTVSSILEQQGFNIKLVEKNRERCEELSGQLNNTLVIHGDGSDVDLLMEEGLNNMDAFIAATGNSETNIISCMTAKNHNVPKTIAVIDNFEYIAIAQRIGVDALVNRKIIAAESIFRYVRKGRVKAMNKLQGVNAEIIEYEVNFGTKVTKRMVRELGFPDGAIIAGVIRDDKCYIPLGDFQIYAGDKVIVFTLPEAVHRVEKLFN